MTTYEKKRIVETKILKDVTFSFEVSDSIHDMEAFEKVGVRFLIVDRYSPDNKAVNFHIVSSFTEIKDYVTAYLRQEKGFY